MTDLTRQLNACLEDFKIKSMEKLKENIKETSESIKEDITNNALSHGWSSEYSNKWTSKKEKETDDYVAYRVKNTGREKTLSHLLENGHLIVNQYGTWSRVGGGSMTGSFKHIEPAINKNKHKLGENLK